MELYYEHLFFTKLTLKIQKIFGFEIEGNQPVYWWWQIWQLLHFLQVYFIILLMNTYWYTLHTIYPVDCTMWTVGSRVMPTIFALPTYSLISNFLNPFTQNFCAEFTFEEKRMEVEHYGSVIQIIKPTSENAIIRNSRLILPPKNRYKHSKNKSTGSSNAGSDCYSKIKTSVQS
jgi:hypothetical protein